LDLNMALDVYDIRFAQNYLPVSMADHSHF
jgi:hypothetical protein